MTDLTYAATWADTRLNDLEAHRALYAASEDFVIETRMVDDHLGDTISKDEEFVEGMTAFQNKERGNGLGVQSITVTEAFRGSDHLLIHWDWALEDAATYRGFSTDGKVLTSKGSTFLRFDDHGKIILESTFLNENPVFQQLGIPLITPHYWEEGFDPSTLMA